MCCTRGLPSSRNGLGVPDEATSVAKDAYFEIKRNKCKRFSYLCKQIMMIDTLYKKNE